MEPIDLDDAQLLRINGQHTLVRLNGRVYRVRNARAGVWEITETLGSILIGHGHLHTTGTTYQIVTPTSQGPKHPRWQHVVREHLTVRKDLKR